MPTKKARYTISMSHEEDTWLNEYCKEQGLTKSDAIERILRIVISPENREYARKRFQTPESLVKMALAKLREDEKAS